MTCAAESPGFGDNWPEISAGPIEGAGHDGGLSTANNNLIDGYRTCDRGPAAIELDSGECPGRNQMPLLLVQLGSVPAGVGSFLSGLFPATGNYCTGDSCTGANLSSGALGVVFGGPAAVATTTELSIATLLSGGKYTAAKQTDLHPTVDAAKTFYTTLHFGDVFTEIARTGNGDHEVCDLRGALAGVEYTGVYDDANLTRFLVNGEVLDSRLGGYQGTPVTSNPVCTGFDEGPAASEPDSLAAFVGDSLSDHFSATQVFNFAQAHRLTTTGAETPRSGAANPVSTAPSARDANHASDSPGGNGYTPTTAAKATTGTFGIGAFNVVVGNNSYSATGSVTITLTRPKNCSDDNFDANACSFTGSFTITTSSGTITGTLAGEMAPAESGPESPVNFWSLEGMYTLTGGTLTGVTAGAKGGFESVWDANETDANSDDTIFATNWDGLAN
jgi:hypothetical protein